VSAAGHLVLRSKGISISKPRSLESGNMPPRRITKKVTLMGEVIFYGLGAYAGIVLILEFIKHLKSDNWK
jgi:hypothetical protein